MTAWERMLACGEMNAIDAQWLRRTSDPALYQALWNLIEARSRLMQALAAYV